MRHAPLIVVSASVLAVLGCAPGPLDGSPSPEQPASSTSLEGTPPLQGRAFTPPVNPSEPFESPLDSVPTGQAAEDSKATGPE